MAHSLQGLLAEIGGIMLLPVFALAFAFWLWMLVDCVSKETDGGTKIAWLLIIIFVNVIGAPLYFFLRKLPRERQHAYHPPPGLQQPWRKEN